MLVLHGPVPSPVWTVARHIPFSDRDSRSLFINCATISPEVHVEVETLVEKHGGQSLENVGEQHHPTPAFGDLT